MVRFSCVVVEQQQGVGAWLWKSDASSPQSSAVYVVNRSQQLSLQANL